MVFCGSTCSARGGGRKDFCKDERGMTVEQIIQKNERDSRGAIPFRRRNQKMLRHLEQMEEYAACGKAYREEVSRNVVKLCGLAQPQISSEVMKRVTEGMSLDDLKVFEKAFRTKGGRSDSTFSAVGCGKRERIQEKQPKSGI